MKGRNIFTNYVLKFPVIPPDLVEEGQKVPIVIPIRSIKQIEEMREGYFAGDEIWSWLDSRVPIAKRNRVVSGILLKSRKRGIDIAYTTQSFHQVDRRIRSITDFLAVPFLNVNETICRIQVYTYPAISPVRQFKFPTAPIFELYSTNEEIEPLEEEIEHEKEMMRKRELERLKEKKAMLKAEAEIRKLEQLKKECGEEDEKEFQEQKEEAEAELIDTADKESSITDDNTGGSAEELKEEEPEN